MLWRLARAKAPFPLVTAKGADSSETLPMSIPLGARLLIFKILLRLVSVPTRRNPILCELKPSLPGVGEGVGTGVGVGVRVGGGGGVVVGVVVGVDVGVVVGVIVGVDVVFG